MTVPSTWKSSSSGRIMRGNTKQCPGLPGKHHYPYHKPTIVSGQACEGRVGWGAGGSGLGSCVVGASASTSLRCVYLCTYKYSFSVGQQIGSSLLFALRAMFCLCLLFGGAYEIRNTYFTCFCCVLCCAKLLRVALTRVLAAFVLTTVSTSDTLTP